MFFSHLLLLLLLTVQTPFSSAGPQQVRAADQHSAGS
jgi:hypothetical protein